MDDADVLRQALHAKHRMPGSDGISPFEAWFGRKPRETCNLLDDGGPPDVASAVQDVYDRAHSLQRMRDSVLAMRAAKDVRDALNKSVHPRALKDATVEPGDKIWFDSDGDVRGHRPTRGG